MPRDSSPFPRSAKPGRLLPAAVLVAAAAVLYAAVYARFLRHYWMCSDDAEIAYAASSWLWRGAPAALNWWFKHGMGDLWLTIPFLGAFGEREAAIYWRNGAFGVLGVVSCSLLAYELGAGLLGAVAAAWLLAMTRLWILLSLSGIRAAVAACALAVLSLALWLRAGRTREPGLAAASALALGVALWTRSTILAWAAGLAAAAAAGALPSPWTGLTSGRRRLHLLLCAGFFLLPQAPFLIDLVRSRELHEFWQIRPFLREYGGSYSPAQDLLIRFKTILSILDARGLPALALAALVALIAVPAWRSGRTARRDALPWIVIGCYTVLSVFSPSALAVYHMLPLVPLVWAALCALAAKPEGGAARRLALASITALLCWRVAVLAATVRDLEGPRGAASVEGRRAPVLRKAMVSDAARALYDHFEASPAVRPVFVGLGPVHAFLFRSRGRITPVMVDLRSDAFPAGDPAWKEAFALKDAEFVVAGADEMAYRKTEFCAQLARRRLRAGLVRSYDMEDGTPGFDVYRTAPARGGSKDCGLVHH